MLFSSYQQIKQLLIKSQTTKNKNLWRLTISLKFRQSQQPALLFKFFFTEYSFLYQDL